MKLSMFRRYAITIKTARSCLASSLISITSNFGMTLLNCSQHIECPKLETQTYHLNNRDSYHLNRNRSTSSTKYNIPHVENIVYRIVISSRPTSRESKDIQKFKIRDFMMF
jgi:hypothetical protein